MAKKRKKSAKPPKRLMGVKVPKTLRKVSFLRWLLDHPTGRRVLGDALVAAATAAAAALAKNAPSGDQVAKGGQAVAEAASGAAGKASDLVSLAVGAFSEAIGEALGPKSEDEKGAKVSRRRGVPGDEDRKSGRRQRAH
jgi:hypothetical protein